MVVLITLKLMCVEQSDNVATLTFTLLTRSTLFRLQFNILLRRTLLPRDRFWRRLDETRQKSVRLCWRFVTVRIVTWRVVGSGGLNRRFRCRRLAPLYTLLARLVAKDNVVLFLHHRWLLFIGLKRLGSLFGFHSCFFVGRRRQKIATEKKISDSRNLILGGGREGRKKIKQ